MNEIYSDFEKLETFFKCFVGNFNEKIFCKLLSLRAVMASTMAFYTYLLEIKLLFYKGLIWV